MKSINTIRCSTCYLIPKIFKFNYNEYSDLPLVFTILCPNNHIKRIYNEKLRKEIKFSLNDIPCKKCNIKYKSKYYCKECYAILCEKCKEIHFLNFNHKDIIIINEIDNMCLKHSQNFYLLCKTCEIAICKECIKSEEHKGHIINELKTLNINKIKTGVKKYKNNFKKNLEKNKKNDIEQYKINKSQYSSISEIEQKYQNITNNILIFLNLIIDLIKCYELYISYYNLPNYRLLLDLNLFWKNLKTGRVIYCKDYQKDLDKIDNCKYYDSYHHKKDYEEGYILYCGLFKDENDDYIYVYYNLNKKKLNFFNLETWTIKKEINLSIKEEIEVKSGFWRRAYAQLKFFRFKEKEYFLVYLENKNTISIYDITDNNNCSKIFFRETDSNKGKIFVEFFNKQFHIIFANPYETDFFNIYNQLKMKLITQKINLKSILIFRIKNIGKMLFISNDDEGIIYNLKSLKIYTKIAIEEIKKFGIGTIEDKKYLIISCGYRGHIIYIIEFFTQEIIFKYYLRYTGGVYGSLTCITSLFLMDYKLYISIINDDYGNCYSITSINLITDEEKREDRDIFVELFGSAAYELKKIKLKNFGECVLERDEDLSVNNKIGLYFFNKNVNDYFKTKFEYENKIEKKISDCDYLIDYCQRIVNDRKEIIKLKKLEEDLDFERLLKTFKKDINNKNEELKVLKSKLYKLKNCEFKTYIIKLEELYKKITSDKRFIDGIIFNECNKISGNDKNDIEFPELF